jgi:hypothetical protein
MGRPTRGMTGVVVRYARRCIRRRRQRPAQRLPNLPHLISSSTRREANACSGPALQPETFWKTDRTAAPDCELESNLSPRTPFTNRAKPIEDGTYAGSSSALLWSTESDVHFSTEDPCSPSLARPSNNVRFMQTSPCNGAGHTMAPKERKFLTRNRFLRWTDRRSQGTL